MTDKRREVEDLRQEISKVDAQLLARARAPREAVEEGGRGAQVARVADLAPGARADRRDRRRRLAADLPPEALREIFREIVATCFSLETPVMVAFCGLDGAFAHAAARSRFGVAAEYTPCDTVAVDARRGDAPARELRGRPVRDAHRRPHAGDDRGAHAERSQDRRVLRDEREPPAREQGRRRSRRSRRSTRAPRTARTASASSRPSSRAHRSWT